MSHAGPLIKVFTSMLDISIMVRHINLQNCSNPAKNPTNFDMGTNDCVSASKIRYSLMVNIIAMHYAVV